VEAPFGRAYRDLDRLLAAVREFCTAHAIPAAAAFALELTAEELFTNLVRHNRGGGDHILFGLERTPDGISMRLTDYDVDPVDVTLVPPVVVSLPAEARRPGGLGLYLVKTYMDHLVYEYADRTLRITATKRLED
jgi:serine/threonine-protein kinase RsbW